MVLVHVVVAVDADDPDVRIGPVQAYEQAVHVVEVHVAVGRDDQQRRAPDVAHHFPVLAGREPLAVRDPEPRVVGQHVFAGRGPRPQVPGHQRFRALVRQPAVHPALDAVRRLRAGALAHAAVGRRHAVLEPQQLVQSAARAPPDLPGVHGHRARGVQHHEPLHVFRIDGGEQLTDLAAHAVADARARRPPHVLQHALHGHHVVLDRPPRAHRRPGRQPVARPVEAQVRVAAVQQRHQAVERRAVVLEPVEAQHPPSATTARARFRFIAPQFRYKK